MSNNISLENTHKNINLIYDVGMHKGEDTDFYLKKGFKVIGFEADPRLISHCKNKFLEEIKSGILIIVEGAISGVSLGNQEKTIRFFRNKKYSSWGTISEEWASRYEKLGAGHETIEVPRIDFSSCLIKYGIPYYLKIDIEGMDSACLLPLIHSKNKPSYISIEIEKNIFGKAVNELNMLKQMGYKSFKTIQQENISNQKEPNPSHEGSFRNYKFPKQSSGLFGKDLPSSWKDYMEILDNYHRIFLKYKLFGESGFFRGRFLGRFLKILLRFLFRQPMPGWYDLHARHLSESTITQDS